MALLMIVVICLGCNAAGYLASEVFGMDEGRGTAFAYACAVGVLCAVIW